MRIIVFAVFCIMFPVSFRAQSAQTENLVIVTLDGFRWQELFHGADSILISTEKYTEDIKGMKEKFWSDNMADRRSKLMPFIWSTIADKGQIFGNRDYGNFVNNANPHWFSYPGYNEIFTGYPDSAINSNDKIPNPHENVLEFLNKQQAFRGKIAAFTSWDVFPAILNENRSGVYVNSAYEKVQMPGPVFSLLDEMQYTTYRPLGDGVRPDLLTYYIGKEYIRAKMPRVIYLSFDETDDMAHGGRYDLYLQAANMADRLIGDLWNFLQFMPAYQNKTALLITTDHGRGDLIKDQWRDHGTKVEDANQIWIALMGPTIRPLGENKSKGQWYQAQLAATIAALLGVEFKSNHPVAQPLDVAGRK
jgi:hypothetical protein